MPPTDTGRWCRAEMECDLCGHQWEAVYPERAYDAAGEAQLECGGCGHMVQAPHQGILMDEDEDDAGGAELEFSHG